MPSSAGVERWRVARALSIMGRGRQRRGLSGFLRYWERDVRMGRYGKFGLALLTLAIACFGTAATAQQKVVIYSSNDDTLHKLVFAAFTKETGIAVEPVSAGSGV